MKDTNINVVELFAGVGGFRLGLERASKRYKTIWANQWEPSRKSQHAYDCYVKNFDTLHNCVNKDIAFCKNEVPNHDLLVGGFPCQDYSVARTNAAGIEGKKGVLWWEIYSILKNKSPNYIILENVDRLLKSPSSQRGKDFGIMLKCFDSLGYSVEWRLINAADYGYPQKRRRVFIFATKKNTKIYNSLSTVDDYREILIQNGIFAKTFNVEVSEPNPKKKPASINIRGKYSDIIDVSENFTFTFYNSGFMYNGEIYSEEVTPVKTTSVNLKDIILNDYVPSSFFLKDNIEKWEYLKGAKKIERTKPNGEKYFYTEGSMSFPDNLDSPARTMLTSESSVNRSSHVVKDFKTSKLRVLTPIECERLNTFPDNWTNTGMPDKFRYFVMGNALVVDIVTRIGLTLEKLI